MASGLKLNSRLFGFERKSIETIARGSEQLLRVVDECLEYSKLMSGGMPVLETETSLQEILYSVVNASEEKAADKGNVCIETCYDASVPGFVSTDGHQLTEILHHILENAVKQCRDNGTVKLGVSVVTGADINYGEKNETCLRFVIKDSGKGMKKDQLTNLFQPSERRGFGMAIAAKLVEGLGGNITVKSKIGVSTTITVDLPVGGKPVDTKDFGRKLQRATVWIVGNQPKDNLFLCMLAKYGVDLVKLDSCGDMEALIQSQKAIDKRRVYLCLVQENLYRPRAFLKLSSAAPSVLLTFGPHRLVPSAMSHFPSLTRTLPSVIAKAMVACVEVTARSHEATLRRAPSSKMPRMRSFDYSNVRVLIAEDGAINQKILQRMLRRKGVKHIDVVDDGQKAVDAVHVHKKDYDIIFMDNQMPTLDGIDACRLVLERKEDGRPQPEIAFVTADVSEAFRLKALHAGANGFISKPFTSQAIETYFHSETKLTV